MSVTPIAVQYISSLQTIKIFTEKVTGKLAAFYGVDCPVIRWIGLNLIPAVTYD